MERIQGALRSGTFSEAMPEYIELRNRVPSSWRDTLRGVSMRSYLNERDMKEYELELDDKEG